MMEQQQKRDESVVLRGRPRQWPFTAREKSPAQRMSCNKFMVANKDGKVGD